MATSALCYKGADVKTMVEMVSSSSKKTTKVAVETNLNFVKKIIWTFVTTFYLHNSKIKSLSVRRNETDDAGVLNAVVCLADKMCKTKLKQCLQTIYRQHYLYELTGDSCTEKDAIQMLFMLNECCVVVK
ncbi:hypothetical protein [Perigonia lusca single nucleopolyhedrovirus]|uniref:Uncharacterized protein n=1 Tax=Perigonia lusca single nucleopolyhedrovirus TaxID=1675865 RepID=A0A0M3N071_9ABAC|nr:hypothetical protein [Perigonia lusca single nucleopolyhedrovirus]AKN80669.1 hypothetical protein [Perigonia lusca single nucleopolyhedrovirus]